MGRLKYVIVSYALMAMLAMPGVALASGNTTDIEQRWIDFQKAVTDQMVKEGRMTRQDADKWVSGLVTRFAESPGDSVYPMFSGKNQPKSGADGGNRDWKDRKKSARVEDAGFRVYSMMTGKTAEDLKKACASGNMTIWQLAKKEGRLEDLKARILEAEAAGLDAFVKGGVMTQEQRSRMLEHVKSELDSK